MYLEYHKEKKQVVEIHEEKPTLKDEYDYTISDEFKVGDEFEWTIWVNEVDEEKELISHSSIRNNPNGKRLLEENEELKQKNADLEQAVAELSAIIGGIE